ncbi:hypothetical protein [Pseudoxanthomonas sp.]|uniref:hypothetical protein n=1 Tax=Pseudoxanthomonas sp. TaxID=1871049 RepID=UPI0026197031|nr:hypothetical protein [Pseudoxanthomonas sp.]WDS36201.1 MAG: hypothetical protein O8I58_18350 [Pseudoxanthomonas sp.]
MSIQGWYYLHENGDLIYKPNPDSACDIRDSDFARCMWPMDPGNREGAWNILVEALALGAHRDRVEALANKWGCDDADAERYADRIGVVLELDGNAWCAHWVNFTNMQEHPVGFGATKLEAMAELAKALGLPAGKMWRTTLKDLISSSSKVAA